MPIVDSQLIPSWFKACAALRVCKSDPTCCLKNWKIHPAPETNGRHLKITSWNFGDSYWKPSFLGVSGFFVALSILFARKTHRFVLI